ncbi:unnamed protein product [Rotaria socialis]|uniref:Uncharacterized protein n=1 Tax=Rotaria socialis TaxID=392032 RepID=A0A817Q3E8_9BILA|nr:unnamed protein product [Rotaria socialis]CAF3423519.1 unnamed protein product [Rotaria socialis]CAF3708921.1 unnamed protein product [Rotaria socialis]CAF4444870.1 unnamed protein product [Rotaria socialis]CAF4486403.1 unnamed protein product [Rotaria socialis]
MTATNNANDVLLHIFTNLSKRSDNQENLNDRGTFPQQLNDIGEYLDNKLGDIASASLKSTTEYEENRIGPPTASLNLFGATGIVQCTRFDYTGIGSFNTVRADVCVFRGKWQYEVLLETRGVMQFGWCTVKCHFSQEIGVGDTWTSFSYDGGRVRKWNVQNSKYGDSWLAGDIISCLIDCDEGSISFKRNGVDLGVAFENIPYGKGVAYFPAISLSQNERVKINFGATPFRHPTVNYLPIDEKPQLLTEQADFLLNIFEQVVCFGKYSKSNGSNKSTTFLKLSQNRILSDSKNDAILMIISQQIIERLCPLLASSYIVQQCLISMFLRINRETIHGEHVEISTCLDYFWAFLQSNDLLTLLTQLFLSLNVLYFFEPVQLTFEQQRQYLFLLYSILKHEDTRKLSLESIFFIKVKLPLFIDIKPPDSDILKQIIPDGWSRKKFNLNDLERDLSCLSACRKLKEDLKSLETIQIEILKLLLTPSDVIQHPPSSKFLFITKFRSFLKENLADSPLHNYQPGIIRNFFHRLLNVLEFYWNQYHEIKSFDEGQESSLSFDAAYVPSQKFIDNNLDYFNLQRLGGVQSHLEKEYSADIKRARSVGTSSFLSRAFSDQSSLHDNMSDLVNGRDRYCHHLGLSLKSSNATGSESLTELLDGLILLYHVGVHKHYVKVAEVIDSLREYNESLVDIDNKIMNCRDDGHEIRDELLRSKKIFEQQTEDLTRKIAWITMHVFSQEKRHDIVTIHRSVYRTLQIASEAGNLFSFIPEIYLNDIYLNTFTALNVYYPTEDSGLSRDIAIDFVQFIANHMQDTRIVNSDVRDNMTQSLSAFCFYAGSLRALEGMRESNRTILIRALLTPYANRPWAMTNLILVRFWRGCGFGFRYSQAYPSKFIQSLRKDRIQDSSPSMKYQQEIGRYLLNNIDDAIAFLNSLLGQLNWAFSEFMGLLKDLVPTKARYMPTIEHRQMKICSTCFDVTVSLLRTIEMSICVAPTVMLDKHSTKSEMLLIRLLQLLAQIINRLATKNYSLEDMERLKMYALDNIQPYPIFSSVCGILVHLINRTSTETSLRVCRAIYNEADLDLSCLRRLIYGLDSDVSNSKSSSAHFTLVSQPEINRSEAHDLDELYRKLNDTYEIFAKTMKKSDDNDDSICIICYSHQIQGEFRPCRHQACLSCISMHFMTNKDCFFCKTHVGEVVDLITGHVIDSIKPNENNTKDK